MIGQRLTIDRELGARIRSARLERNLSEAALGSVLGLSSDQVSRLETGETRVSSEQLTEIAAVLGKTVVFFFSSWAASGALDLIRTDAVGSDAGTASRGGGLGSTRPARRGGYNVRFDRETERDATDHRVDYLQ